MMTTAASASARADRLSRSISTATSASAVITKARRDETVAPDSSM
jgi:hypothetical protein